MLIIRNNIKNKSVHTTLLYLPRPHVQLNGLADRYSNQNTDKIDCFLYDPILSAVKTVVITNLKDVSSDNYCYCYTIFLEQHKLF